MPTAQKREAAAKLGLLEHCEFPQRSRRKTVRVRCSRKAEPGTKPAAKHSSLNMCEEVEWLLWEKRQ